MIEQSTIDKILDRADIVEVVSQFVTLKRRGVNYVGLCPFHDDKSPSFYVSPAKNICKCFACGVGGNPIHFVMKHEQMTFPEAVRWMGKKYGIEVEEEEMTPEMQARRSLRESMFVVNDYAGRYFQDILWNDVDGRAVGLAYLRGRGMRDDIIKKFQIGYSTNSRDAFSIQAQNEGFKPEFLIKTGLSYEREGQGLRDRFWGRVVFPWHTVTGKITAFSARVLDSQAKVAKYVNSPESEIYSKRRELYGIYFAKREMVARDKVFLVEGQMDVIAMHQAGIENVVASSGTALTTDQIRLIRRFTPNVTVLYDGDTAGIKASLRGIDLLLYEGMNIRVLLLPDGEDPDSFSKARGAAGFKQYIEENEQDFIQFKARLLSEEAKDDPVKKAEMIADMARSIGQIPDKIVRFTYLQECASMLKVRERVIIGEIDKYVKKRKDGYMEEIIKQREEEDRNYIAAAAGVAASADSSAPAASLRAPLSVDIKKERELIRLIIRYGEMVLYREEDSDGSLTDVTVAELIDSDLRLDDIEFSDPVHRAVLRDCIEHIHDEGFVAERHFLSSADEQISLLASDMVSDRYQLSNMFKDMGEGESVEDRLSRDIPRLLINFKVNIVEEKLRETLAMLKDPALASDTERYMQTMKKYRDLTELRGKINDQLGRVVLPG